MSTIVSLEEWIKTLQKFDEACYERYIGKVTMGENTFLIHFSRKANLRFVGEYLVNSVQLNNEEVWNYKQAGFDGNVFLALDNGNIVLAFTESGRYGRVVKVESIAYFVSKTPLTILQKRNLKDRVAQSLERRCLFTDIEERALQIESQRMHAAAEKERAEKREQRTKAKKEKIDRIMSRPKVEGRTAEGQKRHGQPATEDEWQILRHDTFIMLVESYDDESHEHGQIIESFRVDRSSGSKPEKEYRADIVPSNRLVSARLAMPQHIQTGMVEIEGGKPYTPGLHEVLVFAQHSQIAEARNAGLNSGTFVTSNDRMVKGGRHEIFSVTSEKVETVGYYQMYSV